MSKYEKIRKKAKKYKKAYKKSSAKAEELEILFEDLQDELGVIKQAFKEAKKKKKKLKEKYKAVKKELDIRRKAESAPKELIVIPKDPEQVVAENLKVINGIGPKLEQVLHAAQILTIERLANLQAADLQAMLEERGLHGNIYKSSSWIQQAKELRSPDVVQEPDTGE